MVILLPPTEKRSRIITTALPNATVNLQHWRRHLMVGHCNNTSILIKPWITTVSFNHLSLRSFNAFNNWETET